MARRRSKRRLFLLCLIASILFLLSWHSFSDSMLASSVPLRRLLLLIPTSHKAAQQRDDIRQAWLRLPIRHRWTVERRFVVCDGEYDLFVEWDMVQVPCVESYDLLSSKVMAMIAWAASSELDFDVLVKVDADVFVQPNRLLSALDKVMKDKKSTDSWWWGFVHRNMRVNRDETDKNRALDSEVWAGYPPYAVGALYAMSHALVKRVARVFESGRLFLLRNEDQTMGIVMKRLGVVPHHTHLIQQWPFCSDVQITVHPVVNHTAVAIAVSEGKSLCHFVPKSICPLCIEEQGCVARWKDEWNCSRNGAELLIDRLNPSLAKRRYASVLEAQSNQGKFYAPFLCNYKRCSIPWSKPCEDDEQLPPGKERLFVLVWTSSVATFTLRQFRVVESIVFHHGKHVRIAVFSNTLPCTMFAHMVGVKVRVVRYNLEKLASGLPGQDWLDRMSEWESGPFFHAHMSDFVRLVVLSRYGGIYSDFDSILVNKVPDAARNVLFAEPCDTPKRDHCFRLQEMGSGWSSSKDLFYFPNGVMILEAGHPLLARCLSQFSKYNPKEWSCGAAYLSNAVRDFMREGNDHHLDVLDGWIFYPVGWKDTNSILMRPVDENHWRSIEHSSLGVHFWNKVTADLGIVPGSFLHFLLERFAMVEYQ